jgi:hypothetical protein
LIRRPLLQRGDQWDHLLRPLLYGLTILALSNCTTESCDCLPVIPAIVMGHVVRDGGTPVEGAQVSAFSGAAPGCESLDTDFGIEFTGADGGFRLGLASADLRERVCVLVFARTLGEVAPVVSDTVLLVMDFRDALTQDSAEVELVLRAE